MKYTDIGVNLCSKAFANDLSAVIDRASQAGVKTMLITGSDVHESRNATLLARKFPELMYSTAGVHPHLAAKVELDWERQLLELFADFKVCAVGEAGLDFDRNYSPPKQQKDVFEAQLELGKTSGLPVFLHEREAGKTFREIFSPWREHLSGGVLHCFTGSREDLYAYLDLDLYIGITGWICDSKRGLELQQLVREIPDDRLLIETDAPYLLPHKNDLKPKSRRNEPAFLPYVAASVAKYRQQSTATIANLTRSNAIRLFRLND